MPIGHFAKKTIYAGTIVSGFKNGVTLGIVTGIISCVMLFLPMMIIAVRPTATQLMRFAKPEATHDMIMKRLQGMKSCIIESIQLELRKIKG